jgi:hypothetical protein
MAEHVAAIAPLRMMSGNMAYSACEYRADTAIKCAHVKMRTHASRSRRFPADHA